MEVVNNLQDWVTSEMVRGRYIFTKEDVSGLYLPISDQALQNSLKRLTNRGINNYLITTSILGEIYLFCIRFRPELQNIGRNPFENE